MSAAVAMILALVDWKEVARKLIGDTAADAAKTGRKNLLRRLQPDERQKAAKQAVSLFTEEFLKELDDKSPLSAAIPGYHQQLQQLIEPAAVDIAGWFQPEIGSVDLAPVARMWSGLNLDPLPGGFRLAACGAELRARHPAAYQKGCGTALTIRYCAAGGQPRLRSALRAGL